MSDIGLRFRPAVAADLPDLVTMQEPASVAALSHIFPQDRYPFPRDAVLVRWTEELRDPAVFVYVSTSDAGAVTGFAARCEDELLHFGTALDTWGSGLASELYGALLATFPAEPPRLRLRVFAENHRARRFWAKHGWQATGAESLSPFPPHPVLLEYELLR